jgi:hypothetical protein
VQADLARGDLAAAEQDIAQLRHAAGDTEAVGVLDSQIKLARLDMAGAQAELEDVRSRFPDSRNATLSAERRRRQGAKPARGRREKAPD